MDCRALFLTGFCLIICTCLTGYFLKRHAVAAKRSKGFGNLRAVLRKVSFLVFLGKILLFGILCGSVQNFFFWFLRELGGGQTVLGACLLANCASSVVVLRGAAVLLRRVGEMRTMYLVLPVYATRYVNNTTCVNSITYSVLTDSQLQFSSIRSISFFSSRLSSNSLCFDKSVVFFFSHVTT